MKFDVNFPDFEHPGEKKDVFKQRFLMSLNDSFRDSANHYRVSAAVLHVPSGMRRSFWQRLAFWRQPTLSNLPKKAQWAAEALCEQGYDWSVGWFYYKDSKARRPALFVTFPSGYFDPAQMALFMSPTAVMAPPVALLTPPAALPAPTLAALPAPPKGFRGSHLRLVWNRDTDAPPSVASEDNFAKTTQIK